MQTVEKRAVLGSFIVSGRTLVCYHSLCNLPIPVTTPGPSPPREPFWFVRTLPGRVFLLSSVLLLILIVVRLFAPLPEFVELFRKVVRVAWFSEGGSAPRAGLEDEVSRLAKVLSQPLELVVGSV